MKNLFTALVAFQAECPVVQKDDENPHFKSKFATILAMKGTVQPLLAKHGLAVLQFPIGNGSGTETGCRTIIVHTSGESIEGDFLIPIGDRIDAQKACAAVSYARRFALSGALGLVTAEDVDQDGNDLADNASTTQKVTPKKVTPKKVAAKSNGKARLSPAQLQQVTNAAVERAIELGLKDKDMPKIGKDAVKAMGFTGSKEIPASKLGTLLAEIAKWTPDKEEIPF
jgi:hypothetical protein